MFERKLLLTVVLAPAFAASCATPSRAIPTASPAAATMQSPSPASPVQVSTRTLTPTAPLPASQVAEYGLYCPTENHEARQYYNDAHEAQDQGDVERAKQYYSKAIELDPEYCDAMDNLGLLLRGEGNVVGAVTWYEKSIAIEPSNRVAHQNLAVAYRILGKLEEAKQEYQRLVQLDPNEPEGYFGLGSMYLMTDRPEDAIAQLKKAEALYEQQSSPYVADARYYLGCSYFTLKDCQTAHEYMQSIYKERADDPVVNYVLGACYLAPELKDTELARKFLLRAQELGLQVPPAMLQQVGQ